MADSNITKRALASALRELMEELPFDKIQVAHICEKCGMNRKSFYYHFKDKYDLLNWIFDTEIISFVQDVSKKDRFEQRVEIIQDACDYFYANRKFYRKALKIEGQNSFKEHFREYIMPVLKINLAYRIGDMDEFELNFFADAATCAIERWLLDKNCMPPDEFVSRLFRLVQRGAEALNKELSQENNR